MLLPLLFQPHVPLPRLALFRNPRNEEFAADLVECAITPGLAEDETGCAGQRFENLAGFGLREMIVANNVAKQIVFRDDVSSSAGSDQKSKCCDRRFPELLLQTIQSAVEIITKETPNGFPVFSFFEKCLFFFLVLPKGETGDLNLGEVDSARVAQLLKRGFERIESGLREASREMTGRDRCTLEWALE